MFPSSVNFITQPAFTPFRVRSGSCDSERRISSCASNQIPSHLSQFRSTPNVVNCSSFYWEPMFPETFFYNVHARLLRGECEESILKSMVANGRFAGLPSKHSRDNFLCLCSDFIFEKALNDESASKLISFVHDLYDAPLRYWAIKLESHNASLLHELKSYSSLNFWKEICASEPHSLKVRGGAEREIESWQDVTFHLKNLINSPPPDRDSSKKELRRVRSAVGALTMLQRFSEGFLKPIEFSRNTNRYEELLLFLNGTPEGSSFPNCQSHMTSLYEQLRFCAEQFPVDKLKKELYRRLILCLKTHAHFYPHDPHFFKKFFSDYAEPIYQASIAMLREALIGSLQQEDRYLKSIWKQAVKKFPNVSEESLRTCEDPRGFERFLLYFWSEYTQCMLDPVDIMKKHIACFSERDFELLLHRLDLEYPENRYKVFRDFFEPVRDLTPLIEAVRLDLERHSHPQFIEKRLVPRSGFPAIEPLTDF